MSFGQNAEEQKKILKTYDLNKAKDLMHDIKEKEKLRQFKIDSYLLSNVGSKTQTLSDGKKYTIVDIIDGKPVFISSDNALAAKGAKTNKLYPGGSLGLSLEGENMNIGVWDGGWVRGTHTEFNTSSSSTVSRVSYPDTALNNPASDGHGTHVAGTIGARGASVNAKGMAPKSKIRSFNWDNDEGEVVFEVTQTALLISNHSYGVPIYANGSQNAPNWYMGNYNDVAAEWDQILFDFPSYLMVASAGNSGAETYTGGIAEGYDKLTGNKNSKNNLVIANANPTVHPITGVMSNLEINSSSSQGPTDDGRIKPDLAADGTNLFSSYDTDNTSYQTISGTSMASPSAAGTLLLLQQHYNNLYSQFMKAATLKALVCHTAIDDAAMAGPDPKFGWGMLNAEAAAQTISKKAVNEALIVESVLNAENPSYTKSFSVSNPNNLKATISWTDPAGVSRNGSLNNSTPALVNDLDLRITSSDGTIYYPWKLQLSDVTAPAIKGDNIVDTVEGINVEGASGTNFTVTVTHKGSLVNQSQAFSLILTGTGVNLSTEENSISGLNFWPNPATDNLYFNLSNGATVDSIKIFDISGKQMNVRINHDFIDVSALQQGVYIIKLNTESSSNTYKFLKK